MGIVRGQADFTAFFLGFKIHFVITKSGYFLHFIHKSQQIVDNYFEDQFPN